MGCRIFSRIMCMNFLFYMVMRDFLYGVIRNHTFNILPMELVEKKYTGQTEKNEEACAVG